MSNSRKRRRALARMQARDSGPGMPSQLGLMKMAGLIGLGAIVSEMNHQTEPTIPILNGTPRDDFAESQDAAPAQPEADQTDSDKRKQAFKSLVAEFVTELRNRCLAQTGKDDSFTSRGQTYRWKLVQDETPRKCVIATYKVIDDTLIRSMSVEMNSAGTITCGPAFFRSICESLRLAREERAAAATAPPPAIDPRPTMAFCDYQLVAMRNACSFMGQNLLWLGESPDSHRIKLLAECVDMIDAGLAAIGG
jgi:hypothetical protein